VVGNRVWFLGFLYADPATENGGPRDQNECHGPIVDAASTILRMGFNMIQFLLKSTCEIGKLGCRRTLPRHLLHRITALAISAFATLFAQTLQTLPVKAESTDRPNIVLILADDQGNNDLGCFGSPNIRTPNIDRMAAEGMRLTSFYSAASVCTPSRAAVLTGCYPDRIGGLGVLFPNSKVALNPEEVTIPEMLRQHGYATACFGKWCA